ncbi:hypothetical protein DAI22_04g093200 [Oryza sativa Japonica Group]|nr:hypothetical protein DAI22_04g093200 [Oryza sativa Japonica Group]
MEGSQTHEILRVASAPMNMLEGGGVLQTLGLAAPLVVLQLLLRDA